MKYINLIFSNPVFWTSIFLPSIFWLSYQWTEKKIRDDQENGLNEEKSNENKDSPLSIIKSDWSHAWNDFNNQLSIVVSSIIFAILQSWGVFNKIYDLSVLRNKDEHFLSLLFEDCSASALFFWLLVMTFLLAAKIVKGKFSTLQNIRLYFPKDGKYKVSTPKLNSPLTIFRIFIILYSLLFMIWKEECYDVFITHLTP